MVFDLVLLVCVHGRDIVNDRLERLLAQRAFRFHLKKNNNEENVCNKLNNFFMIQTFHMLLAAHFNELMVILCVEPFKYLSKQTFLNYAEIFFNITAERK